MPLGAAVASLRLPASRMPALHMESGVRFGGHLLGKQLRRLNGGFAAWPVALRRSSHRCGIAEGLRSVRKVRAGLSQKIQKSSKSLLTVWRGADYIRLTNEGGAPLATKKFASKSALCEIQESRVSDTRPAPKPKAERAHDIASAMSVL